MLAATTNSKISVTYHYLLFLILEQSYADVLGQQAALLHAMIQVPKLLPSCGSLSPPKGLGVLSILPTDRRREEDKEGHLLFRWLFQENVTSAYIPLVRISHMVYKRARNVGRYSPWMGIHVPLTILFSGSRE